MSPHRSLTWIQHDSSLVQLSQADIDDALTYCEGGMPCLSCGLKEAKDRRAEFGPIPPRGFAQRGHKYHIDDYVYIIPSQRSNLLYRIGRITKVKAMDKAMGNPPQVYVRLYGRFDDVVRKMRKEGPLFSPLRTDEVP
jgi:DNA (cytosine-5)-methyltransferase 1